MKEVKPKKLKVNVKPVFVQLVHSAAYEGPCRVGKLEALTPENERKAGKRRYEEFVADLRENLSAETHVLQPTYLEWGDDFVVPESELRKLEPEVYDADLILMASTGLPQPPSVAIAQRYRKPVGMMGWVASVDICAYLRARGQEGYAFLDFEDLNHFLSLARVRKAVRQSRFLIALEGGVVPAGVVSSIWDLEGLKGRYGVDYVCVPAEDIFQEMTHLPDEALTEAEELTDRLVANAVKVHMKREDILPSVRFYLATKRVMGRHEATAFVIPCFEICARRTMQRQRVTFCLAHSLLKDEGIPSACEGDVNVLAAMTLLMYTSRKSAHMGNSSVVDRKRNVLAIHHDVPGLKMRGLQEPDLPYEIVNFTVGGWGATIRADVSAYLGGPVTMARFNPAGTKLLVAQGELVGCKGYRDVGCSLRYHFRLNDIVDLFRKEMDFGHHLAWVFGDYRQDIRELGELMGFEVVEV